MKNVLLVLILAVAVAGCTRVIEMPASAVSGATPTPADLPPLPAGKTVLADGQLASPYPSLALSFGGGVSGQVLTITVQAGDVIKAGDELAVLDDTDLQRAVTDAQLALDRATTDRANATKQWERDVVDAEQALQEAERALSRARLQYSNTSVEEASTALDRARQTEANAKDDYNKALDRPWEPQEWRDRYYDTWQRAIRDRELAEMRLADAQDSRGANSLELEARQDDVVKAQRKLDALKEGLSPSYERAVQDAQQKLTQAEEALKHARLFAPWNAIVLSIDVAPKANVGPNVPVVTLLNVQDGLRFVTQNLSEQHIANIHSGQKAVVTLRTFPDNPLEGTVEAIVPQIKAETADKRFAVHVRLPPTDLDLLPGLTGRVEIFAK